MKEEKFKVLLYLKKSCSDKSGKSPIMGRITIGDSVAQFSCKLSCTPDLWNPRESRLNGKGREAVGIFILFMHKEMKYSIRQYHYKFRTSKILSHYLSIKYTPLFNTSALGKLSFFHVINLPVHIDFN